MENRNQIAVFGLGFVGLPLALSFAMRGAKVVGVDIDTRLIKELNQGITHHLEAYQGESIQEILKTQLAFGRFEATADPTAAMEKCNSFIVTVGIPVVDGNGYMGHLESVSKTIAKGLKKGDLVVIRSTVVPGTVRSFIQPILEESGLKAGEDFFLGYASERIAEGKAFDEFENMPTLVSGVNEASAKATEKLLKIVTKAEIVIASSIEVVETSKVLENLSRDINIAMVNEFAKFTKKMGIDIFEVIKVANTHKRVNLLYPGPGVGGYCIPNAFYYLKPRADELGVGLELSAAARAINKGTPNRVAEMAVKNLQVAPKDAKICILGMAMKDYSSDDRMSPALDVIEALQSQDIEVAVYDPAIPAQHPYLADRLEDALQNAHGIIVLAKQDGIDFDKLEYFRGFMSGDKPFIIDTRNIYCKELVEGKGFVFEGL
ncbi:nucleotide sugar dehydrogenase [Geosporobacter ferrireducens]|uniref:nucleotide sugar dehydrogenase n=1 Tax=Geosporobacter ferrireducens TaxID=1424294 RepID=UPI00139D74F2|nr:nucleotide sugar dehydrogenase [Geosporobacter ferrireducens]MTI55484.1 nucleotide sugar dehydrogenase [Geosporobacter ferrireducens]